MKADLKPWLAFAAVSFFWGTTYLATRIGVQSIPPFLMAALRQGIAGICLILYFKARGYHFPSMKDLKVFSMNGIIMLAGGNGIITWGMQYVDSGMTSLICALTPVWIVLLNYLLGNKEKITAMTIIGFLVCIAGQVLIFKNRIYLFNTDNFMFGVIAVVLSNILWALGTIYSKNHKSETHPLFASGIQMLAGSVVLSIVALIRGEQQVYHPNSDSLWALLYLIVFGSWVAFGSFMYVIKKLPANVVSTYAYINTAVGIILGWLWLGEPMDLFTVMALVLTIGGVYLVSKSSLT